MRYSREYIERGEEETNTSWHCRERERQREVERETETEIYREREKETYRKMISKVLPRKCSLRKGVTNASEEVDRDRDRDRDRPLVRYYCEYADWGRK